MRENLKDKPWHNLAAEQVTRATALGQPGHVGLATSVFLGLTLAFEPRESELMDRPPRNPRKPILTFPVFMRTGLVSLIMLAGAFGLFYWEHGAEGRNLSEARTTVVNVIVMVQAFYQLNSRSLSRSMFSVGVFSNHWIWLGLAGMAAAQLLFTYAPFMNQLFHTTPVRGEAWLYIAATGVAAYVVVEFEKWVRFGFGREKTVNQLRETSERHA